MSEVPIGKPFDNKLYMDIPSAAGTLAIQNNGESYTWDEIQSLKYRAERAEFLLQSTKNQAENLLQLRLRAEEALAHRESDLTRLQMTVQDLEKQITELRSTIRGMEHNHK